MDHAHRSASSHPAIAPVLVVLAVLLAAVAAPGLVGLLESVRIDADAGGPLAPSMPTALPDGTGPTLMHDAPALPPLALAEDLLAPCWADYRAQVVC